MSELEKRLLNMLESLLSISQHFTDNMPVGERKEWQRISAEVADICYSHLF